MIKYLKALVNLPELYKSYNDTLSKYDRLADKFIDLDEDSRIFGRGFAKHEKRLTDHEKRLIEIEKRLFIKTGDFKCKYCGMNFKSRMSLAAHRRWHERRKKK